MWIFRQNKPRKSSRVSWPLQKVDSSLHSMMCTVLLLWREQPCSFIPIELSLNAELIETLNLWVPPKLLSTVWISKISAEGNLLKLSGLVPCCATMDFWLSQQPSVAAVSYHFSLALSTQADFCTSPDIPAWVGKQRFILAALLFRAHTFHQIILPMDANTAYSE